MTGVEAIIYIDFGGSIDFTLAKPGEPHKPLVMAGVGFPIEESHHLFRLLPRSEDGSLLKSSDHGFASKVATEFVAALLKTPACIGGVIANASDPENVASSRRWHQDEQRARQEARRAGFSKADGAPPRKIGEFQLNYIRLLFTTLNKCVAAFTSKHGIPDSLTVIPDREDIGKHSEDLKAAFANAMQSAKARGSIRWESRGDEPLLYLPDLVAGIVRRHFHHDDALDAFNLLWAEQERSPRVQFANKLQQGQ